MWSSRRIRIGVGGNSDRLRGPVFPDTLARVHRLGSIHRLVLPLWAAGAICGSGCSADKNSSLLEDMFEPLFLPTPQEAAVDLFNPLDADKQFRALSLISASPFGGEAPYVKAYRLMLGRTEEGQTIGPDEDPIVRAAAIKALGAHGTVEDAKLIARFLEEESSFFVRWEAAKALQRIHNPAAIGPLVGALSSDVDLDVRMAAATALGQYANRSVFDALVGALADHDFGVVDAAYQSLRTLTGNDYGKDGADWLGWADKYRRDLFVYRETYGFRPYRPPQTLLERIWVLGKRREPVAQERPIGS